jgi:hypothetical protein
MDTAELEALIEALETIHYNAAIAQAQRQRKRFQPSLKLSRTRLNTFVKTLKRPSRKFKRNNRQTAGLLHDERSRPGESSRHAFLDSVLLSSIGIS